MLMTNYFYKLLPQPGVGLTIEVHDICGQEGKNVKTFFMAAHNRLDRVTSFMDSLTDSHCDQIFKKKPPKDALTGNKP